jgi:hypothetical protein
VGADSSCQLSLNFFGPQNVTQRATRKIPQRLACGFAYAALRQAFFRAQEEVGRRRKGALGLLWALEDLNL